MPLLEPMWMLADSLADAPKCSCEGFPLANDLQDRRLVEGDSKSELK